jgi:hypothetical protein
VLNWSRSDGFERADPKLDGEMFVGMVRPQPEFNHDAADRLVAHDSRTYEGDPAKDRVAVQQFWEDQINIRPFSPEFVKCAGDIWSSLGIRASREQTAFMMRMESIDDETTDAVQAALFATMNTSSYPVDMEALAFALSTFIHGHPAFRQFVSDDRFVMPYGAHTMWAFIKKQK